MTANKCNIRCPKYLYSVHWLTLFYPYNQVLCYFQVCSILLLVRRHRLCGSGSCLFAVVHSLRSLYDLTGGIILLDSNIITVNACQIYVQYLDSNVDL